MVFPHLLYIKAFFLCDEDWDVFPLLCQGILLVLDLEDFLDPEQLSLKTLKSGLYIFAEGGLFLKGWERSEKPTATRRVNVQTTRKSFAKALWQIHPPTQT